MRQSALSSVPTSLALLLGALLCLGHASAQAQATCSSDEQKPASLLLERFINADCEACWLDANSPQPARGQIAIDWIVPGSQGDDASLSAAATRDGLERLKALNRPVPRQAANTSLALASPGPDLLRVAHGPALNGYLGTSIEWRPPENLLVPVTAWLVLVENLPPGTEGTVVPRRLVRNALTLEWPAVLVGNPPRHFEARPMRIPDGAQPDRLALVGWIEDANGRMLSSAFSRCEGQPGSQ